MNSLENKIAFVTGAAAGIGKQTAITLAAKGAKVILTDIDEKVGQQTTQEIISKGGKARFFQLDVSNKQQIDEVIAKIMAEEGTLDLAVNNAGIGGDLAPLHKVSMASWNRMMDVNLHGLFFCLQAELNCMLPNGGGRIVNVSSLAGLGGVPGGGPYSVAKHGVVSLTKTAAMEYGKHNIRINAVCPGFTETSLLDSLPPKRLESIIEYSVPMKRMGQVEEIANAIVWLLSEESSYVNGLAMPLDGGVRAA